MFASKKPKSSENWLHFWRCLLILFGKTRKFDLWVFSQSLNMQSSGKQVKELIAYHWRCKQCHLAVLFRNASFKLPLAFVRNSDKRENRFIVTHFPISLLMSVHMFNVWLCWIWSLSWKSSSNLKHLLCEFSFPRSHIIVYCLVTTFGLKTKRHVCEEIYEIWMMITHNGEIAKKMLCLDNCEPKCENFFKVLKQKTFMRQCMVPWRCSTVIWPRHEKSDYKLIVLCKDQEHVYRKARFIDDISACFHNFILIDIITNVHGDGRRAEQSIRVNSGNPMRSAEETKNKNNLKSWLSCEHSNSSKTE